MPLSRLVGISIALVALSTVLGAGYVVANQAATTASTTTNPSMTTTTVTVFQNGVTTITQTVTRTISPTAATTTRTVTETVTQPTTQTQTTSVVGSGTIGIYSQVANYSIVPVSNGMQPAYLGSHYDLFIPMHVMDWYTVSCGTPYNISGTLYWYNYSASGPYYHGVGNLEVYSNATYNEMIIGTQILSFTSNGTSNVTFTSLFTAC